MNVRPITVTVFVSVALAFLGAHTPAFAQSPSIPSGLSSGFTAVETVRTASGIRDFGGVSGFILAILAVVTGLIAVVALAALLYGAVLYITSMGDEGKTETAKKIILYAIIGLLVLGVAGIVVNVVINFISV